MLARLLNTLTCHVIGHDASWYAAALMADTWHELDRPVCTRCGQRL